jgi:predicted DNA-binding protein with PD1-like motif
VISFHFLTFSLTQQNKTPPTTTLLACHALWPSAAHVNYTYITHTICLAWQFFLACLTLKTKALWSFKALGTMHQTTQHHTSQALKYVSIQFNESADVVNAAQLYIHIRYAHSDIKTWSCVVANLCKVGVQEIFLTSCQTRKWRGSRQPNVLNNKACEQYKQCNNLK